MIQSLILMRFVLLRWILMIIIWFSLMVLGIQVMVLIILIILFFLFTITFKVILLHLSLSNVFSLKPTPGRKLRRIVVLYSSGCSAGDVQVWRLLRSAVLLRCALDLRLVIASSCPGIELA